MKKPFAPYSRQLAVPADNATVYILIGRDAFVRGKQRGGKQCLVLPPDSLPSDYQWPVAGCGVILLDRQPLSITDACEFARLLHRSGAEAVLWCDQVNNDTQPLFKDRNNKDRNNEKSNASRSDGQQPGSKVI